MDCRLILTSSSASLGLSCSATYHCTPAASAASSRPFHGMVPSPTGRSERRSSAAMSFRWTSGMRSPRSESSGSGFATVADPVEIQLEIDKLRISLVDEDVPHSGPAQRRELEVVVVVGESHAFLAAQLPPPIEVSGQTGYRGPIPVL